MGTTEIEVPNTVTEVGTGAFGEVTNITFNGEEAPEGIENALSENATVNIPEGSKGNYEDVLHENTNIVEIHTHRFAEEWTYDEACHWKAATCGHDDVVQKLPHTFGEWIVTRESTEDVKGIMERSCACGYTETEEIAQLPHMTHIKDDF